MSAGGKKRKSRREGSGGAPEIIVAKQGGFCFGVRRAVEMAFEVGNKGEGGAVTFGPIIHNPQVIETLRQAGVVPIESTRSLRKDHPRTVIIRTHGIPQETLERIGRGGHDIIDATCPFVKKAQRYAKLLRDEGYQVIILGDAEHPEVKGLVSYAGRGALVLDGEAEELPKLESRVGIVVQTTQPVVALKRLVAQVLEQAKEVKVYNTICNSTALRLKETSELARRVDVLIVVGGKNSANTTQLANLARSLSVPVYHIEEADEIKMNWFEKAGVVGITAGASTPDWIIQEVCDRIQDRGGSRCHGNE